MRPFDGRRYDRLLKGLEAYEVRLSELERTQRLDAEFFTKEYVAAAQALAKSPTSSIDALSTVSDGNHFAISDRFADEGIPYYRGQDCVGHFFIEQSHPVFIDHSAYSEPHMIRSHLKKGDVLLSIVGSVGELSLVSSSSLATCSCKLAILRPKTISPEYLAVFLKSSYGFAQIQRYKRGAVQMGLLLEDLDQIHVVRLGDELESAVSELVQMSKRRLEAAVSWRSKAAEVFVSALGLNDWTPPPAVASIRRLSETTEPGRLDAEYYEEGYRAARRALQQAGAARFAPMRELLSSLTNGHTPLRHDLTTGDIPLLCAEHISNFEVDFSSDKYILTSHHQMELARTSLRDGDVLLTIKGRTGNAALIEGLTHGANINQDVALLRFNKKVPVWYVLAFINSFFGNMFTRQMNTGGINPFLGLFTVREIPIPIFDDIVMKQIAKDARRLTQAARIDQQESERLLKLAIRVVEVAVEHGPKAATAELAGENLQGGAALA